MHRLKLIHDSKGDMVSVNAFVNGSTSLIPADPFHKSSFDTKVDFWLVENGRISIDELTAPQEQSVPQVIGGFIQNGDILTPSFQYKYGQAA